MKILGNTSEKILTRRREKFTENRQKYLNYYRGSRNQSKCDDVEKETAYADVREYIKPNDARLITRERTACHRKELGTCDTTDL